MKIPMEINRNNNKEYKIEAICDHKIYIKKSDSDYLPWLYYLVF